MDGGHPHLYFYPSFEGIGFRTASYIAATSDEDGAELLRRIDEFAGRQVGREEPSLSHPERILESWAQVRESILTPYVERLRIA